MKKNILLCLAVFLLAASVYLLKGLFLAGAYAPPGKIALAALAAALGLVLCHRAGGGLPAAYRDKAAAVFAALLAVATVAGNALYPGNTFHAITESRAALLGCFLQILALYAVLAPLAHLLLHAAVRISGGGALAPFCGALAPAKGPAALLLSTRLRSLFVLWAVLLLCFLPCWLAYWPGMFNYDLPVILPYGDDGNPYSTHHPLLYSLFVNALYDASAAGGTAAGVLLVSAVQMPLMAFVLAAAVWYLGRMGVRPAYRAVCLAYFALNPVNPLFALVEAKDTPFAGAFLLTTILLVDYARDASAFLASRKKLALLCALVLLLCALRNNAVYAVAVAAIVTLVLLRGRAKKLLACLGCVVAVWLAMGQWLFPALGVSQGPTRELLSVPVQQMSLTYLNHVMDMEEDERNTITNNILQNMGEYNPRFADPMKNYTRDWPRDQNTQGFMRMWLHLAFKYPQDYATAFLTLNLGSWYTGMAVPDPFSGRYYIETANWEDWGVERASKLPALLDAYEGFATRAEWQGIPFLSLLFDTGAPVWACLFGLLLCLRKRWKDALPVFLLPLALWGTILFGPVTNGRYVYPFLICYPVYLIALFANSEHRITPE